MFRNIFSELWASSINICSVKSHLIRVFSVKILLLISLNGRLNYKLLLNLRVFMRLINCQIKFT